MHKSTQVIRYKKVASPLQVSSPNPEDLQAFVNSVFEMKEISALFPDSYETTAMLLVIFLAIAKSLPSEPEHKEERGLFVKSLKSLGRVISKKPEQHITELLASCNKDHASFVRLVQSAFSVGDKNVQALISGATLFGELRFDSLKQYEFKQAQELINCLFALGFGEQVNEYTEDLALAPAQVYKENLPSVNRRILLQGCVQVAAMRGHLNVLEVLGDSVDAFWEEIAEAAASTGQWPAYQMVKRKLDEKGYSLSHGTKMRCLAAAAIGIKENALGAKKSEFFKLLINDFKKSGESPTSSEILVAYNQAASAGDVAALDMLESEFPLFGHPGLPKAYAFSMLWTAASAGQVPVLEWVQRRCPLELNDSMEIHKVVCDFRADVNAGPAEVAVPIVFDMQAGAAKSDALESASTPSTSSAPAPEPGLTTKPPVKTVKLPAVDFARLFIRSIVVEPKNGDEYRNVCRWIVNTFDLNMGQRERVVLHRCLVDALRCYGGDKGVAERLNWLCEEFGVDKATDLPELYNALERLCTNQDFNAARWIIKRFGLTKQDAGVASLVEAVVKEGGCDGLNFVIQTFNLQKDDPALGDMAALLAWIETTYEQSADYESRNVLLDKKDVLLGVDTQLPEVVCERIKMAVVRSLTHRGIDDQKFEALIEPFVNLDQTERGQAVRKHVDDVRKQFETDNPEYFRLLKENILFKMTLESVLINKGLLSSSGNDLELTDLVRKVDGEAVGNIAQDVMIAVLLMNEDFEVQEENTIRRAVAAYLDVYLPKTPGETMATLIKRFFPEKIDRLSDRDVEKFTEQLNHLTAAERDLIVSMQDDFFLAFEQQWDLFFIVDKDDWQDVISDVNKQGLLTKLRELFGYFPRLSSFDCEVDSELFTESAVDVADGDGSRYHAGDIDLVYLHNLRHAFPIPEGDRSTVTPFEVTMAYNSFKKEDPEKFFKHLAVLKFPGRADGTELSLAAYSLMNLHLGCIKKDSWLVISKFLEQNPLEAPEGFGPLFSMEEGQVLVFDNFGNEMSEIADILNSTTTFEEARHLLFKAHKFCLPAMSIYLRNEKGTWCNLTIFECLLVKFGKAVSLQENQYLYFGVDVAKVARALFVDSASSEVTTYRGSLGLYEDLIGFKDRDFELVQNLSKASDA